MAAALFPIDISERIANPRREGRERDKRVEIGFIGGFGVTEAPVIGGMLPPEIHRPAQTRSREAPPHRSEARLAELRLEVRARPGEARQAIKATQTRTRHGLAIEAIMSEPPL